MPWPKLTLRERRQQTRDHYATYVRDADSAVPNSVDRALCEAQAALTHDNDTYVDNAVRMVMPDTAEGEFAERWANIWLPKGRKGATFASGFITVRGNIGAVVSSGTVLTVAATDDDGAAVTLEFEVTTGVTLTATTAAVRITALTPGALTNLDEGAELGFESVPAGIEGAAVVASPGLAGGADEETDEDLRARYIARIQEPPHGGAAHDYVAWMLEVPGVTRAWVAGLEMGVGTVTCRFMMDDVRAGFDGIPQAEDLALVQAYIDALRPVTVADCFVVAPIKQTVNVTVTFLTNDTPEVRANIRTEVAEMLRARAEPGRIVYASWIREAISAATGEDHHDVTVSNITPLSNGHLIFVNVVFA